MGGSIRFDSPADQQQSEHDTENQLLLFRQAVHDANVTSGTEERNCQQRSGKCGITDEGCNNTYLTPR